MRPEYLLGLSLILLGCPAEPEAPSPSPPVREEIRDWQLESQGQSPWTLAARLARRDAGGWQFRDLHWQSRASDLQLSSPEACQLQPKVYHLPSVKAAGWQARLQARNAELNLSQGRLKGQRLRLEGPGWTMEANTFSAPLPLRNWSLQRVHARFRR